MTFSQRFRVPAPKLICNNGALSAKSQVSSNSQLPLAARNRSWTLSNLFTLAWMHLRFLTRRQYTNEYFLTTTCITCVVKPHKSYKWHISMDIEAIHCRPVTPHKSSGYDYQLPSLFKGGKSPEPLQPMNDLWKVIKQIQANSAPPSTYLKKKKQAEPGSARRQTGHNKSPIFKCKASCHVSRKSPEVKVRSPNSPPWWSLPPLPWRYQGHVNTSTRLCCHLWYLRFVMYVLERCRYIICVCMTCTMYLVLIYMKCRDMQNVLWYMIL